MGVYYWMDEGSGVLAPVVEAYLHGRELSAAQIAVLRAYLRQWINAPVWTGPEAARLRIDVDSITTPDALRGWLGRAVDWGLEPL